MQLCWRIYRQDPNSGLPKSCSSGFLKPPKGTHSVFRCRASFDSAESCYGGHSPRGLLRATARARRADRRALSERAVRLRRQFIARTDADYAHARRAWSIQMSHWKIQVKCSCAGGSIGKIQIQVCAGGSVARILIQLNAVGSVEKPRRIRRVRWKIHGRAGG
jgi:hypothetical protein